VQIVGYISTNKDYLHDQKMKYAKLKYDKMCFMCHQKSAPLHK